MKKVILSLFIFMLSFSFVQAQDYQTGIGLRGGFSNGITIKHFLTDELAIEGILSTRWKGFLITGLAEFNRTTQVDGLNWYYGFGGHIGIWNNTNSDNPFTEEGGKTIIGADGILGLEFNFSGVPINLSLDWKPAFNLIGYTGFWGDNGAFSIRYIF